MATPGKERKRLPYRPEDILAPTKYRLVERRGRGAFGEVWEAQHVSMDRSEAIKIMYPLGERDLASEQIAKEARIAHVLRQRTPHVADVFDVGVTDLGFLYIVMELLKGSTLRERITKRFEEGRFTEIKDVVGIAFEMTHAIAVAHAMGIVHLDLKPENVFLARQFDQGPNTTTVKVLDFGIAKLVDGTDEGGEGLLGTARYAPPEQFSRAHGNIGPWSDCYSIGHVIFEVAAGQPTFEIDGSILDRHALEEAQLLTEAPDLREFRKDAPAALAMLVRQCLRKQPQDRPPSAVELGKTLGALSESLRGKQTLVSLPAISDFDLSIDALNGSTTQPSPAPTPVLHRPPSPPAIGSAMPHAVTEEPPAPNRSESFLDVPAGPAIAPAPIMVIGASASADDKASAWTLANTTQPLGLAQPVVHFAQRTASLAADDAKTDPCDPPFDFAALIDKTDPSSAPLFYADERKGPPTLRLPTVPSRPPEEPLQPIGPEPSTVAREDLKFSGAVAQVHVAERQRAREGIATHQSTDPTFKPTSTPTNASEDAIALPMKGHGWERRALVLLFACIVGASLLGIGVAVRETRSARQASPHQARPSPTVAPQNASAPPPAPSAVPMPSASLTMTAASGPAPSADAAAMPHVQARPRPTIGRSTAAPSPAASSKTNEMRLLPEEP